MNTAVKTTTAFDAPSKRAYTYVEKTRLALRADWDRLLFIHYAVDPEILQPYVPYPLDVFEGKAYVSAVPFYMKNMRPTIGGALSRAMFSPIATHELFNVRTYVKHGGEHGVLFMAEWIPNAISRLVGPYTYGLPYRLGTHRYAHYHEKGHVAGEITSKKDGRYVYGATLDRRRDYRPLRKGTLSEFLLERYVAFTARGKMRRAFRVWHPPWITKQAHVHVMDDSLVRATGDWFEHAEFVCAEYAPGYPDVWMSVPHHLRTQS